MPDRQENESAAAESEQLLNLLDAQLACRRCARTGTGRNRTLFASAGVLLITLAAGVALFVLQHLLSDLATHREPTETAPAARGDR